MAKDTEELELKRSDHLLKLEQQIEVAIDRTDKILRDPEGAFKKCLSRPEVRQIFANLKG